MLEKLQALFDRVRAGPYANATATPVHVCATHVSTDPHRSPPLHQRRGGRDMWQRKALEAQFEGEGLHAFLELLRVVAYNMSNGPWRGLWVRYGYDPTRDPVARCYQVIDVRWTEAGLQKLKGAYHDVYVKGRGQQEQQQEQEQEQQEQEQQEEAGTGELKLWGCPLRRQMVRPGKGKGSVHVVHVVSMRMHALGNGSLYSITPYDRANRCSSCATSPTRPCRRWSSACPAKWPPRWTGAGSARGTWTTCGIGSR